MFTIFRLLLSKLQPLLNLLGQIWNKIGET
jgi:hypothetical protein